MAERPLRGRPSAVYRREVAAPCLGRSDLLATVRDALGASRWVTLVGPPGSGKTLLARHAVADRDPVTWVHVGRLDDVGSVVSAVLRGLGVQETPGDDPSTALMMALGDRPTTLVLDGARSEIDGLHDLVAEVADQMGEESRILCTTDSLLGRVGEHVVRVGPLPVPQPGEPLTGPAHELFLSSLARAGGSPQVLAGRDEDVRRLLASTGGLPLLVEQVAVQVALTGSLSITPSDSLDGQLHASYALLDEATQRCFRRLACLPGPASLGVIHHVVGAGSLQDSAGLVSGLARRSLLEVGADGRIDLLPPIRALGERLRTEADAAGTLEGLLRWAESVAPAETNSGAADAPWLGDLPSMVAAVEGAAASPRTRPQAYDLANRVFSSLYAAMQTRTAVDLLDVVLASGDGPPGTGAQVARRAGIAKSEVEGTYAGLALLDRADAQAAHAPDALAQAARNASIRAEMHLDAGRFGESEAEALRVLALESGDQPAEVQALRTLADVHVSRGDFTQGRRYAELTLERADGPDDVWLVLSARTLLGRIALEQGRVAEAAALARDVMARAAAAGEDRVGLLAEVLLRAAESSPGLADVDVEALPWSVRLPVLMADVRSRFHAGDVERAAGLAADAIVLADRVRLGRESVGARLLLAHCTARLGDTRQAAATLLGALEACVSAPLPLRAADALDLLAVLADDLAPALGPALVATARELRVPRGAAVWGLTSSIGPQRAAGEVPQGWVVAGGLSRTALTEITAALSGPVVTTVVRGRAEGGAAGAGADPRLALLTRSERAVAEKVAEGLTSRQIAAELFVSPRTVDAHLTHIYRKLDIPGRARLAALVADAS